MPARGRVDGLPGEADSFSRAAARLCAGVPEEAGEPIQERPVVRQDHRPVGIVVTQMACRLGQVHVSLFQLRDGGQVAQRLGEEGETPRLVPVVIWGGLHRLAGQHCGLIEVDQRAAQLSPPEQPVRQPVQAARAKEMIRFRGGDSGTGSPDGLVERARVSVAFMQGDECESEIVQPFGFPDVPRRGLISGTLLGFNRRGKEPRIIAGLLVCTKESCTEIRQVDQCIQLFRLRRIHCFPVFLQSSVQLGQVTSRDAKEAFQARIAERGQDGGTVDGGVRPPLACFEYSDRLVQISNAVEHGAAMEKGDAQAEHAGAMRWMPPGCFLHQFFLRPHSLPHHGLFARTLRLHKQCRAFPRQVGRARLGITKELLMTIELVQHPVKGIIRTACLCLHDERVGQVDDGFPVFWVALSPSDVLDLLERNHGSSDPWLVTGD